MKKILIILIAGYLYLPAITVSTTQAIKQGEGFAIGIDLSPTHSLEQKKQMCRDFVNSNGLLGATNRNEMLALSIDGCIKKLETKSSLDKLEKADPTGKDFLFN